MKTLNIVLLSISFLALTSQIGFAQANYKAGPGAGASLTTGFTNTFVGHVAGYKTTTGSENSFYGSSSGYYNVSGKQNSFFGNMSGMKNNGSGNSFFGYMAGVNNSTAGSNSFFGYNSGLKTTTGGTNSFFGSSAGASNTTGSANNFFGMNAGFTNTTGSNNTFIGNFSGYNNTTGKFNVFVGVVSALRNTTGSRNVYVGEGTGGAIDTGSDNVFIGHRAANKWTDNSNGNIAIGSNAAVNGTNSAAIGFRSYVSVSNALVLGSISGVNGATSNTNVGIGTHAPAYRLHVNGDAAKPGSSAWTVASDKRLKKDIKEFKDGLEIINQIKPVKYKYNGKAGMPTENEYIGVIAQEVEEVAPYMIHKFSYADSIGAIEEYLDFDATALPFIIINAIKDQQQILEEKDEQLQAVLEELKVLKEELAEIKSGKPGKKDSAANSFSGGSMDEASMDKVPKLLYNTPNPATESTSISYELPSAIAQAHISIHSMTGEQMAQYDISGNTAGEVQVTAGNWKNGIYIYQLWVDGRMADSKRMIVNR